MERQPKHQRGPFRIHDISAGDRHELSNGNAIYCAPTGGSGARGTGYGFEVIDSDPAVESAGIDAGFAPSEDTLRAPDVSVGVPDQRGWIRGVPPLAVEYTGTGQDEEGLQSKIRDLLDHGTRWVWVVRLVGPRRVEVYEPDKECSIKGVGETLEAPGILKNPVPVEALWDRGAAHAETLRNLLQRRGYHDLDAVREEGRGEGRGQGLATALLAVIEARGWSPPQDVQRRVLCRDADLLGRWLRSAVTAASLDVVFADS